MLISRRVYHCNGGTLALSNSNSLSTFNLQATQDWSSTARWPYGSSSVGELWERKKKKVCTGKFQKIEWGCIPSLRLTASLKFTPEKLDCWKRIVSFWEGLLADAMLVFRERIMLFVAKWLESKLV